ncbi:MAG: (2Fe-2S) ferredoxin domain-containing protein [Thermomicrobiales bacterium]|nr:(2Fe-2S) ferredoxin domain-containing protein [Thermomicrobiales bacterium]
MYWTKRHVLICTASHCSQKGAMDVAGRLRIELIRKKLDAEIMVNNCGTIDLCDMGPNVVVYPDNVILRGVTLKDLPDLVAYLRGGDLPDRMVLNAGSPDEQQRRAFYAEAIKHDGPMPVEDFTALAERHGFDQAWIDEQARRGFIARKAAEEGAPLLVTVTTKTRTRYRLNAPIEQAG